MATLYRPGELNAREIQKLQDEFNRATEREGRAAVQGLSRPALPEARVSSRVAGVRVEAIGALWSTLASVFRRWTGTPPASREEAAPPSLPSTIHRSGQPPVAPGMGPGAAAEIQRDADEYVWVYFLGSSNVYAMKYDMDDLTFYVCYLGGSGRNRHGKGPTYGYRGVPPTIAKRLLDAGSAGGAVWDYLRVRGTAFGHQFDYFLSDTGPSGYVPRKATGVGLKPRVMREGNRILKSSLKGTGRFSGE